MMGFKTFVALALIYLIMPGAHEATENLVHLVTHGDLAHAAQGADHHESGTEHDCSGLFHTCLCHTSLVVTVPLHNSRIMVPPHRMGRHLNHHIDLTLSGYPDRLYRPPIV